MKTHIYKKFNFEAAHKLINNNSSANIKYSNIHGHSFQVEIYITDIIKNSEGWIEDFSKIENILDPIRNELDHNFLNDIEGLSNPTLENIAKWIWDKSIIKLPNISKVKVTRGNCGEGCILER